ncbi:MAG: CmpA/NrtA family ABC transporter substrate-binding protein [Pseudomonadota bacterium]
MTRLKIGFIPLVDCAGLIAAEAMGFARDEGLTLELTRESSWATLRDKLAIGAIDAAHLLAPITVASKIAAGNPKPPIIAPMSLSMNGNAISVSRTLFDEMAATGGFESPHDLSGKAAALGRVIAERKASGRPRLTFAVVYPFSPHNYELRYLLAAAGVDPDRDVDIVVVPPPFVVDHLRSGLIDGFCVGAPWTSIGVAEGLTRVIAVKPQIWRYGPEKVLGVREVFANDNEDALLRLIRAARRGTAWADQHHNHPELTAILARPAVLDMAPEAIAATLSGRVPIDQGEDEPIDDYIVFDRYDATFPWQSHALWFYSQMVRWRQVEHTPERAALAAAAYRPDLYRRAFEGTDIAVPAVDAKVEGGPGQPPHSPAGGTLVMPREGFFDGRVFDPADIPGYVAGFSG